MIIEIIVISFIVVWVWITYQLYTAPLFDEDEMPIDTKAKEINENLFKRSDKKEDVK